MNTVALKSNLSEPRRRLLELMRSIGFGRIEGLVIWAGEPVFDPAPRVVRRIKPGSRNGPRSQADGGDFALKTEWIEFFEGLDAIGDGDVRVIEIAHGLPLFFEVEEIVQG